MVPRNLQRRGRSAYDFLADDDGTCVWCVGLCCLHSQCSSEPMLRRLHRPAANVSGAFYGLSAVRRGAPLPTACPLASTDQRHQLSHLSVVVIGASVAPFCLPAAAAPHMTCSRARMASSSMAAGMPAAESASVPPGGLPSPAPRPFKSKRLVVAAPPLPPPPPAPALQPSGTATMPLNGAGGGGPKSCSEEMPATARPLTAFQKRQLAMRDKAIFQIAPNAVYRIRTLLNSAAAAVAATSSPSSTGTSPPLPIGIRVGVKRKGCSGYSFTINYAYPPKGKTTAAPQRDAAPLASSATGTAPASLPGSVATTSAVDDPSKFVNCTVTHESGIIVEIEPDSLFYVIGTRLDYVVSNVEERFVFENPNTKAKCGCGDSFMMANE